MSLQEAEHQDLIIDQFSRQAAALSQPRCMHDEGILRLLSATEVKASDIVLDVACGTGQVAVAFASKAKQVTGIDITPAMIECARVLQRCAKLDNVRWFVGDVNRLPFGDAVFSIVTCRYAFHHILDPETVAREMVRVCVPGGRVAFVDVTTTCEKAAAYDRFERLRDPSHVHALTLDDLVSLANANGLERVQCNFYEFDIELESLLLASFPAPGDEARLRELVMREPERHDLDIGVSRRGTELILSYPIAIVVGEAPDRPNRNQLHRRRGCSPS